MFGLRPPLGEYDDMLQHADMNVRCHDTTWIGGVLRRFIFVDCLRLLHSVFHCFPPDGAATRGIE